MKTWVRLRYRKGKWFRVWRVAISKTRVNTYMFGPYDTAAEAAR